MAESDTERRQNQLTEIDIANRGKLDSNLLFDRATPVFQESGSNIILASNLKLRGEHNCDVLST